MAKIRTYFGWTALTASGVLLLVVVGLVLYSRTAGFRDLLREKTLAALNENVRGQIGLGTLQGSIWANLVLSDLTLRYLSLIHISEPTRPY